MHRLQKLGMIAALCLSTAFGAAAEEAGHGMGHGMGHDQGGMPQGSGAMGSMHEAMEGGLRDTSAFGEPGDPAKVTRTIEVTAREIMFDQTDITVALGETIRFRIKNEGEQAHEFTIGDAAYQQSASAMMSHMSEMGMDVTSAEHGAMHGHTGNTVSVGVGETKEIVWHFTKAGDFVFACNIPGHAEVGMTGAIAVR